MINYILRRLLFALLVLLGTSLVAFAVIQLPPGDFATAYRMRLINQSGMGIAEAEAAAELYRERYGLNDPILIQYFNWIKGIVTEGSFGYSMAYGRDVGELIAERMRALDAIPDGRSDTVAATTSVPSFAPGVLSTTEIVDVITTRIYATVNTVRAVHDDVDAADPSTADLLHVIIADLEKQAWMVKSENAKA